MLTKKNYHFQFKNKLSASRGEEEKLIVTGFGSLADSQEQGSLEIQLKETGQRIPINYRVFLLSAEEEQIILGEFSSSEEQVTKWQCVFSFSELPLSFISLEQIASINIEGIGEKDEQGLPFSCFLTTELSNPEIEFLLDDEEVNKVLEKSESPIFLQDQLAIKEELEKKRQEAAVWTIPTPLANKEEIAKVKINFKV